MLPLVIVFLSAIASVAHGEDSDSRFKLTGDFRLRLEQDWDSLQGDGTKRDDRLRLRVRLRVGLGVELSEKWSVLVTARTGPRDSQQSPHITIHDFDGGATGPYQANLDHWFVSYASGGFDAWVGRNELSFWHQYDEFVFDNVTYAGAGASYRHGLGEGTLAWHLNYVALPVGMRDFSGSALIGQVTYAREFAESGLTVGGSVFASNADPDDPAGSILLTENNTRDYRALNLVGQYRSKLLGKPLKLELELAHNLQDYAGAPPGSFSEFHAGHVSGYLAGIVWGGSGAGDLQLGYFYSHQEALAVNSSYVQDDWVRWGNANQVRATNLKGSELRATYTIRPGMNLFARLFFVHAIDLLEPGDTTRETGNRFRVEYNVSF